MKNFITLTTIFLFSSVSLWAQDDCDVNHDGSVNISDVNKIISRMCGQQDTPVDNHAYVNLGLTSGTLWATCNIGADSPSAYGDYFAWGDTKGYYSDAADGHTFDWSGYKWMTSGYGFWNQINKYTMADGQKSAIWYNNDGTFIGDGKKKLDAADDAATAKWGTHWCTPTHAQMQELINETTNECITIDGVYGCKFTSKKDPTLYIFLPAAGYCSNGVMYNVGSYGFYWLNDLYTGYSDMAWMYYFYSSCKSADFGDNRCTGQSIRPVRVLSARN